MKVIGSLLVAIAVAALPQAADAVTGTWSSPVALTPSGAATFTGGVQAFVAPDGRSLALTNDTSQPLLASGTASGTFTAPVGLGAPAGAVTSVDGAVGADGTIVVGWASGGSGHVVRIPPGGAPGPQTDLPGAGVNGVAVAVGADGRAAVAYRTKEGTSTYAILTATAPPGGAFGAPVTIDAGSAGLDFPDIAAGPGGALAVVYRKLTPRYRTHAAIMPAGAAAFEAPVALSASAQADQQPRVAFDADGTAVAAWGNPEGPAYALRPPDATAWTAAAPLSPAGGDSSSTMDLVPTPQGGTAAAWAGNGVVRAAVQPVGAGFGEPAVAQTYTGNIVAQPAVAVAPDGTLTVLAAHPQDGAVTATDLGGATTIVGYGAAEAATPVALAASADRTLAVWRDATGSIAAATRSASAPPSTGPGPRPAAPDKTPPKLRRVGTAKRTTFRKLPTTVNLRVSCDEPCVITGAGNLRTTVAGRRRIAPLPPYAGRNAKRGTRTIVLKLGSFVRTDLQRAVKARRGGVLFLDLSASDAAGNFSRLRLQLSLQPAARRNR